MNITLLLLLLIAAETSYVTYKTLKPQNGNKIEAQSILLDTSVLIDGRIESIARSGLVTAPLVVPRSVIRELQYMADKADHDKRERARYGLDMIEKLQAIENLTVTVIEDAALSEGGVDERLVILAKESNARLCTTDYNLNKAARVQGVIVLNINEIAHALRIVRLPGEQTTIILQQAGQERDQAVGYLDDGTMVVVDNGKSQIGKEVAVEITRALQTVAGKMLFAKLVNTPQQAGTAKKVQTNTTSAPAPAPQQKNTPPSAARSSQPRPRRQPRPQAQVTPSQPKPQPEQPPKVQDRSERPAQNKPRPKRHKSMTDRAEESLVDLLNKQ